MDRIRITGGSELHGSIPISGAKNAALPLMIASLLTEDDLTLVNVPRLSDVSNLRRILGNHGVDITVAGKRNGESALGGATLQALRPLHRRHDRALRACLDHARELLGHRAAGRAHGRGPRLSARRLRHRHASG